MKGQDFKNMRQSLGLERLQLARLIGYTGTDRNDTMRIRKLEGAHGGAGIPLYIARLVWLIIEYRRATGKLPAFPMWKGYEFEHAPDPQHQKPEVGSGFY